MPRLIAVLVALLLAVMADSPVTEALRSAPAWLPATAARITWIGNTSWMAIMLAVAMAGLALCRPDPTSAKRAEALLRVAVACFLLIVVTGIAVQVLKYTFGRPRPAVLEDLSPLTLAPFSFARGWNAFPSGHATTMGALAVLFGRIWPRAGGVVLGVALAVALSRVLVSMHYPSDVVAGLALGAALAMWMIERWQAAGVLDLRGLALPRAGLGPVSGLRAIPCAVGALIAALFVRSGEASPRSGP